MQYWVILVIFQPIKAWRWSLGPTHLSFLPPHHQHDTGFYLSPIGLKWRRPGKGPLLRSSRRLWLPSRTKCWKSTCGPNLPPSTWPTQGGLKCLYLEALHSIFCWSICQPFQGSHSSGIALWGRWMRFCLRSLNGFKHKPVSFAVLMLVNSHSSQWTVLRDSLQKG